MNTKNKVKHQYMLAVTFLIYLLALSFLILFKGSITEVRTFIDLVLTNQSLPTRNHNGQIFESITFFIDNWEYSWARLNIYINILAFVPMGFLVSMNKKKEAVILYSFQWGFWISLLLEYLQFYYNIGEFDIDDILLNTFGAVFGAVVFLMTKKGYDFIQKNGTQEKSKD